MQVQENVSVAALLSRAITRLGTENHADAELLLAHALDRPRAWLYAHAGDIVPDDVPMQFDALVSRRTRGEPVAQLIGRQGFWSLQLRVTPDVLIPRADTELLVECALAVLPSDASRHVLDLGTGSGAIALAIANERPLAEIIAIDSSIAALDVARSNVQALDLSSRVQCILGDWFAPLADQRLDERGFDAIVSNPPYLADDDPHLDQGDLRFEPRAALASGSDGLDAVRTIVGSAPTHLLAGGWLMIEHGWQQGTTVRALFAAAGFVDVATHRDIEARERVTCGCWRG